MPLKVCASLPNNKNMRGRTTVVVVGKAFQRTLNYSEKGKYSKGLQNIPNTTAKRAETLVRATDELSVTTVRVLTSESVLDAQKTTSRNHRNFVHMKNLSKLTKPDSLDSMHGNTSSHAPFTFADIRWPASRIQKGKESSSRRTQMEADIIKQMNSEAVNAICKCARG